MKLTFLTMPLGTNNLYAHVGRKRYLVPRARQNKDTIAWEAKAQYRGKPLHGPLEVEISLFWPDRRRHDIDNIKALLDACTGILWDDDGQIVDLHTMKEIDARNPRVEMHVWELEERPVAKSQKRARSPRAA